MWDGFQKTKAMSRPIPEKDDVCSGIGWASLLDTIMLYSRHEVLWDSEESVLYLEFSTIWTSSIVPFVKWRLKQRLWSGTVCYVGAVTRNVDDWVDPFWCQKLRLCELVPCLTAHRTMCRDSGVSERDFISEVLIAWPFRLARGLSPPSFPYRFVLTM